MRRAREKGILDFHAHDLRDWTYDRHRTTDDYPYGGGCGLVMKCEPIFEAVEAVLGLEAGEGATSGVRAQEGASAGELGEQAYPTCESETAVVFMAPQGRPFNDACALELAAKKRLVFVCGHYEGIDERAYSLATHLISLGDYVLTSGELASMVVIDAVVRKLPGVLGAEEGAACESFAEGLLEYPQYTRPATFRGMDVPEVLLSGHHARIETWRRKASLERTLRLRPDIIEACLDADMLSIADLDLLQSLVGRS